jgi:hypothetical protein
MEQGLIYDPTAYKRIDDFLSSQETELVKLEKSDESQKQKLIRLGVILGVSAILILGLKVLIKRNK